MTLDSGSTSTRAFSQCREQLIRRRLDPEAAYSEFSWPRLTDFNWALNWFDQLAEKTPEKIALWIVDDTAQEITRQNFSELRSRSNRVANFLAAKGVRRGDRILLMLGNEIALWETLLAAAKLGAVVIPTTVLLSKDDLADRISRGEVSCIVAGDSEAKRVSPLVHSLKKIAVGQETPTGWTSYSESQQYSDAFDPDQRTPADSPLFLYFTSGTTARPKLVLHTHQSYPVGHLSTMAWIGLTEHDVHCNISSPGWAKHAWSSVFAPWNAGATVFVIRYERFEPKAILSALARFPVTTMCAPPTVWRLLIQEDLASYETRLRELVSAGEPLNPKVIEAVMAAWGIAPRDGYGQTETTALIGNSPGLPLKPGSMGRPLPGYTVTLLDEQGREATEGEICVELAPDPVGIMSGYVDPGGSSPRIPLTDTYYRTGDIASRDEDGYYTYVGRKDDIFKSADYRISPFELESFLLRHPAVAEVAVVPSPHPTRLCVPKAFVALHKEYQPSAELALDLFRFIRTGLSPFKRIRRIEFAELPKTVSGKIRRVDLRRHEGQRTSTDHHPGEFREEDFPNAR